MREGHEYDDMLDMPRPVSKKHAPMPRAARAGQFSPFAALSGYEAAIDETARRTERRTELDEDRKSELDGRLRLLESRIRDMPEAAITVFEADEKKEGGAYVTHTGALRRIDPYRRVVVMADGARLPIADIVTIESPQFCMLETEWTE